MVLATAFGLWRQRRVFFGSFCNSGNDRTAKATRAMITVGCLLRACWHATAKTRKSCAVLFCNLSLRLSFLYLFLFSFVQPLSNSDIFEGEPHSRRRFMGWHFLSCFTPVRGFDADLFNFYLNVFELVSVWCIYNIGQFVSRNLFPQGRCETLKNLRRFKFTVLNLSPPTLCVRMLSVYGNQSLTERDIYLLNFTTQITNSVYHSFVSTEARRPTKWDQDHPPDQHF